ncbi:gamma-glutamylaminecyclotransferase isoform X1 [Ictalurus punctatus]|uniref:Gamma-glutamylaminecyclotransferase n=1 Tax=Ictalurus punctatus TaxID=7998 RepID=E3TEG9_ICTPU|nr:gamma-glutamylaminecyclotransferase precursor [Ictalurus punctatus]XP_017324518.1 gamma-glutamylaminecyclotransferase isoform X1 [Ictalurus punctatus]ADO28705.1 aig2-like domain-containing protein 1-b [Ictalurus punctatus]
MRRLFPTTLGIFSFLLPATQMTHIFVYGTLKKGQPNHYRMLDSTKGNAKFLGCARTVEKYPLVIADKHNIPFLLNVPGEGQRVQGEIYSVDDPMLKFLDWFESCPQMYQRTQVLLEVEEWVGEGEGTPQVGGTTDAFVYSTTTYKPEWLQYPTFESYDAYGDHGLQYVTREDRGSD